MEHTLDKDLILQQVSGCGLPTLAGESCNAWVTRVRICQALAVADIVGFSDDLLGCKIVTRDLRSVQSSLRFYDLTFCENCVVIRASQLWLAHQILPSWWGIISIRRKINDMDLEVSRHPKPVPTRQSIALAELLWSTELRVIVRDRCGESPLSSRRRMREQLAASVGPDELGPIVSAVVKARPRWRAAAA